MSADLVLGKSPPPGLYAVASSLCPYMAERETLVSFSHLTITSIYEFGGYTTFSP